MATNDHSSQQVSNSLTRIFKLIKLEKREISAIYFYAVLYGLLQLTLPLGIQSIVNFVQANAMSTSLIILIIMVVVGVFLTGLLQVNQMKLNERIQQNLFTRYAFEFSYRLPKLDMQQIDGYYLPELVNRFFDVVSLQKGLSKLLLDIPVASIQIIFGLILLSLYNTIFIFFGLFLIVFLYLVLRFTSKRGMETSIQESDYKYKVAGWLEEMARVLKSIKFSKGTTLHLKKSDDLVSGYLHARTAHFKILLIQYWALIAFKVLITAGMLVVGGILLIGNQLNIGQFIAAEIVILTVLSSVEKFIASLDKVYDILTSVEKLGKVIDKPLETSGRLDLDVTNGISIKATDLSFGFSDDTNILEDISFDIPAGSKVCLRGKEGSGKSTLLRLLTGSFQQFKGMINFNSIPIGNHSLDSLRQHTGIFFSQQEIFQGSLWENITMGSCPYTPQQVMELANKIGLKDYIASLPKGFETPLDPTGKRLPKSISNKILFLRAIASKPSLLLLEEPWQGMEADSRERILNLLNAELGHATVIIASNDPDYQALCDQVIELDAGRLKKIK